MKKLNIVIAFGLILVMFVRCTEIIEAPINVEYSEGVADGGELKTLLKTVRPLSKFIDNLDGSGDQNANTTGFWLNKCIGSLDMATMFLDIPSEAVIEELGAGIKQYSFEAFFWSAEGGETKSYIKYVIDESSATVTHSVSISDSEGGTYKDVAYAEIIADPIEEGVLKVFVTGTLETPDYVLNYSVKEDGGIDMSAVEGTYSVDLDLDYNYSGVLTGKDNGVLGIDTDWNSDASGGSFTKYDSSGNIVTEGPWFGVTENLSIVDFNIIGVLADVNDLTGKLTVVGGNALQAKNAYVNSLTFYLGWYSPFFTPPIDAELSNTAIEGQRWSLVYKWNDGTNDVAYQKSVSDDRYYHNVYLGDGQGNYNLFLRGESMKDNLDEFFEIPAPAGFPISHKNRFELVSDEGKNKITFIQPNGNGLAKNTYTLRIGQNFSGDFSNVFSNAWGDFNWIVTSWTADAATGTLDQYKWGPHEINYTATW
jgi:hypothetical protein